MLVKDYDGLAQRLELEGYVVVDNALGKAHAIELREEIIATEKHAAAISQGLSMKIDTTRRDDRIAFLKRSQQPATRRHREFMESLCLGLEERLELKMMACSYMAAEYPAHAIGYVKHRDASPNPPSGRKLTAIYYLNPDWLSGGELLLWPSADYDDDDGKEKCPVHDDDSSAGIDQAIRIAPINDRILIFKSSLEHRVLPNGPTPRIALTTWFYSKLELALELIAEKRQLQQAEEQEGCH